MVSEQEGMIHKDLVYSVIPLLSFIVYQKSPASTPPCPAATGLVQLDYHHLGDHQQEHHHLVHPHQIIFTSLCRMVARHSFFIVGRHNGHYDSPFWNPGYATVLFIFSTYASSLSILRIGRRQNLIGKSPQKGYGLYHNDNCYTIH